MNHHPDGNASMSFAFCNPIDDYFLVVITFVSDPHSQNRTEVNTGPRPWLLRLVARGWKLLTDFDGLGLTTELTSGNHASRVARMAGTGG